jgi:hypothetical protein
MKIPYLTLILTLLLVACNNESPNQQETTEQSFDLKQEMPGIWESVSVRVLVNSAQNQDSSYVFEVLEENWVSTLGIKPIRTYYELDNKYRTEYISRFDSLTNVKRGMWNAFGDTLMLIEPDVTYQYTVKMMGNGLAEFKSLLDWDGDGQEDDEYTGVQRLVSKSTQ